jgi:hypothetical protein
MWLHPHPERKGGMPDCDDHAFSSGGQTNEDQHSFSNPDDGSAASGGHDVAIRTRQAESFVEWGCAGLSP